MLLRPRLTFEKPTTFIAKAIIMNIISNTS